MTTDFSSARILVVDDDPDMLALLVKWLSRFCPSVLLASDGFDAIEIAQANSVDIVITDLAMPGMSGLHLLSMLKEQNADIEVIVLSGSGTIDDAIAALREGRAFDYLQKPLKDLNQLNQTVERALARKAGKKRMARPPLPAHIEKPSERETEILSLLAEGLDNREIANRLCLSEKTVQNHLTRIYEKLKVSNRTQAVMVGQQFGLI